jgi:omega-6 fatty acid desaturase (delta-12 desaturase)
MNRERERQLRNDLRAYAKRSSLLGYFAVAWDLILFIAMIGFAAAADQVWLKLLCSILAGTMISALFVLGHDATHGSLVRGTRRNAALARLLLLPALHTYALWRIQHNRLHHQSMNIKGMNSWSPMSVAEFNSLAPWKQWRERLYRGGGFGFYYLVERWWKYKFYPGRGRTQGIARGRAWADFALVIGWLVVWCAGVIATGVRAGNAWWMSIVWGVALPFFVWNCLMGLTVYLQHTHHRVPWFRTQAEASQLGGHEELAIHVRYPRWYGVLSHEIMEHPAHHVNPLIPFHRLRAAQTHLNRVLGDEAIVEDMRLRYLFTLISRCKLYDYDRKEWTDFAGQTTAETQAPLLWTHAPPV